MQNENMLKTDNLQESTRDTPDEAKSWVEEINRLKEQIRRSDSNKDRDPDQLEANWMDLGTELGSAKHAAKILWAALLVLAAGLIAASWYGIPLLQRHASLLNQLPGLQGSLNSAGKRLDSAEDQLRGWARQQDLLTGRITKLENRVSANLQVTRRDSEQLAAHLDQILRAELDKRIEPVEARLNQLESGQQAEQARLAQLRGQVRDEVGSLRSETAQQIALVRFANPIGTVPAGQ